MHITTKDFDLTKAGSYNLLIEINATYYRYAIVDVENTELLVLGSAVGSIAEAESNWMFITEFAQVKISTITKSYTFIPEEYYQEDTEQTISKFISFDENLETLNSNFLHKQSIRNIYALKSDLIHQITGKFPSAVIYPQMNSFYCGATVLQEKSRKPQIFINIRNNHLELLILIHGELTFYNIYEYKNDDELLYYLLITLQQKSLKAEELILNISGEIQEYNLVYQKIKNTFFRIFLNEPDAFLTINDEFEKINLHEYFSLLALNLCE